MILFGIGLLVLPYVGVVTMPPLASIFLNVVGAFLLLIGGAMAFYLKYYRRASANQAFVKTGMGGSKVILDRGAIVLPFFHQTVPVSLETMKLEVERRGADALITKDNLRVDVKGEFYIKVKGLEEDILNAARSLGEKSVDAGSVGALVFEKLVSALRSVAATKDLVEIHAQRDAFASGVHNIVVQDLQQNGLTLESVTVSRLDQTAQELLSDTNIFDAQGKKKITEITQAALIERNRIERDAQREIATKDVATRQEVLELERARAEAEATQANEVANVQAQRRRETEAFSIEQDRAVKEAEIQRDLAVQGAAIDRDKALIARKREMQEADIQREQAVAAAGIAKSQAIEVQERQKEAAVAEQEAARAKAQQAALLALAEREKANQQVVTVTATAEAEREARTRLIAAQQVIDQDKIKRQTEAEVTAFAEIRRAEAAQKSAELEAQAKLRLAQAEAESREMIARGEKAQQLIPVDVERERVEIERARVDIERQALENRQTYSEAALAFELDKLKVEAGRDVQSAMARSIGEFMSRGQFNVYGDPTTMAQMMNQYSKGLGIGSYVDGLMKGTPDGAKSILGDVAQEIGALVERFTGKHISHEQAREIAARFAEGAYQDAALATPPVSVSNGLPAAATSKDTSGKDAAGPLKP